MFCNNFLALTGGKGNFSNTKNYTFINSKMIKKMAAGFIDQIIGNNLITWPESERVNNCIGGSSSVSDEHQIIDRSIDEASKILQRFSQ
jgi:hypothetical protein